VRTISIRLDDRTDALFRRFCERLGLSQTDALKAAIEHLAEQQRPSPAELAAELGLIVVQQRAERSRGGSLARGEAAAARQARKQLRTPLSVGPCAACSSTPGL
jgi:hypothetical protein